jgi:hypothetical protein
VTARAREQLSKTVAKVAITERVYDWIECAVRVADEQKHIEYPDGRLVENFEQVEQVEHKERQPASDKADDDNADRF